jgi:spore coat polysaccharide biosynthesis protein SpsF
MKTVAIIQARMGSSRLPGKVLRPLVGQPVLWHVVHRLKQCQELDEVRIATTTQSADDPLVEFAAEQSVPITRGSEDDVMSRYMQTTEESQADILIRVTGDAPLIDTKTIDLLLADMRKTKADITGGGGLDHHVIHEGFTVVSRNLLERLNERGRDDPYVREHVIVKIDEYVPELVASVVTFDPRHFFKGARISVDTPADIRFIETLYQRLGAEPGEIDLGDVVELLKREPELIEINSHVRQKDADEDSYELLIRCDGGHKIGLGHVMRSLSLAIALRDRHSIGVRFVMKQTDEDLQAAIDLVEDNFFHVITVPTDKDEDRVLTKLLSHAKISGLILDTPWGPTTEKMHAWRKQGKLCITIDDAKDRRRACDMAFYPPVPQVQDLDWTGFDGDLRVGWNWVALGPSFQTPAPHQPSNQIQIGILMGGSDPFGLSVKALEAIQCCEGTFHTHVVLGKAARTLPQVQNMIEQGDRDVTLHHDVQDMASLLASFDFAVAAYGVSALELAASSVPSILLSISEDHAQSASALDSSGAARSLGLHDTISIAALATEITSLLNDETQRNNMAEAARNLDIGHGALNIAGAIREALAGIVS